MGIKGELRDVVEVISKYRLGVGGREKRDFKSDVKVKPGTGWRLVIPLRIK